MCVFSTTRKFSKEQGKNALIRGVELMLCRLNLQNKISFSKVLVCERSRQNCRRHNAQWIQENIRNFTYNFALQAWMVLVEKELKHSFNSCGKVPVVT
jgi:hypothetical protein